jgi:outer membrane lipoprotein SlyB/Ca2+-binding EF-hand superfamily protein
MTKKALLLASAIMISGSALASSPDGAWLADFRRADLNDSGGLSQTELNKTQAPSLQAIRNNFTAIDADRDGHVTQAEVERHLSQSGDKFTAKFNKADLNDSGGLSRTELGKVSGKEFDSIKKNFDAIDADRDGQVSLSEYQGYLGMGAGAMASQPATRRADQCHPDCGYVMAVDRYKIEGEGSALGVIAGGVAGGLLGNQIGGGKGKTLATVGGAAGGAYVGNKVEKNLKTKKMVKVTVKFDNGQQRDIDFEADNSPVVKGDRVQVVEGRVGRYTGQ